MKVLVTGANGFIGRNLSFTLRESGHLVLPVTRSTESATLPTLLADADAIVHLAGINRPKDPAEFREGNAVFTRDLCRLIVDSRKSSPILYASSIQATLENPYGRSKREAEEHVLEAAQKTGAPAAICRLPNVFGKWCKPFYNSAVATFCHQITRGEPVTINDPNANLSLVYVDDVVRSIRDFLLSPCGGAGFRDVHPVYHTTVGQLVDQLRAFWDSRETLVTEKVGDGFARALHATFLSYLPNDLVKYGLKKHEDPRGEFVEMLRTKDSGQVSYFTAFPGITRGGHYHHTKTEKFLVIRGNARFDFEHVVSGEVFSLTVDGTEPCVVETVPGWAHSVTNIGDKEMIVMLWANEIFDPDHPDTFSYEMNHE